MIFINFFWRRREGRKREKHRCERETLIGCLPYAPSETAPWLGPNLQPRHVTFGFAGQCPTNWATWARAEIDVFSLLSLMSNISLIFHIFSFFEFLHICNVCRYLCLLFLIRCFLHCFFWLSSYCFVRISGTVLNIVSHFLFLPLMEMLMVFPIQYEVEVTMSV